MSAVKDYPPYLDYPKPRKPQTNADRIRSMSDEELARGYALTGCPRIPDDDVCDSFCDKHTCCYNCWLDWLKQPVKDGEGDG